MERQDLAAHRLGNKQNTQRLFRDDAIRSYVESQEKVVLPRLVSPRTFLYLWSLLGLLTVSSLIAWFVKIPVYASGLAVVTRWHKAGMSKPVVVAFFPPQYMTKLRANQKLFLKFAGDRYTQKILTVEPQIRSPDFIRYALSPSTEGITQPVAVVTAQWQPPTSLPAAVYLGSIGSAEVEIGQERAISLLPVIGQVFAPELP